MQEIGWRLGKLLVAVKALRDIEEVLLSAANSNPCWTNLLKAVDYRVEKALAILRPQSLTDYRTLLVSLGWPPSLLTSNVANDSFLDIANPLVVMQGEMKDKYSRSFLALCYLQQVQAKREACLHFLLRKQMGSSGLWPIDELVSSLALRIEYHFSKWLDQPKFIFALVYNITKNFLDSIENVLQPLIDHGKLLGCSAKEAWLVAMVRLLSDNLERQIFPALTRIHNSRNGDLEICSSLLHIVDLMISFDKRIQILLTSGTHFMESFAVIEGLPPSLSSLSIFIGHPDWLKIWAEIEVNDAEGKLRPELEDERSWMAIFDQQAESNYGSLSFLLSSREDYKAPIISDSVIQITWSIIERGLVLPSRQLRNQFIISSAKLFLNNFFGILLQRSRDVEFNTAILDDAQLLKICSAMNTAHYCEHVLIEWSENVKLMEVAASEIIEEDNLCISPSFIEVLDMLRDRLRLLNLILNSKDFLDLWRSVAGGIDHFIFSSIPMSNARFSSLGVYQFKTDIKALFVIFRSFCPRPEAFFPCISNSLKLLTMDRKDADQLLKILLQTRSEESLRLYGVFHVSHAQAEKILRNRMIGDSTT
ncbi:hypothetical protein AXF42_Ash012502 [Apostasia shenzhenica]|uniref:RINT1-like protein MAG2L n=1 Tax=Apostasia shenzhenica TaxID=1088818 RepID=A0A2I0AQX8_9ASPA|nr:hypothetical protein AXF42_Ash012502 [Apostasia shenzhenica]